MKIMEAMPEESRQRQWRPYAAFIVFAIAALIYLFFQVFVVAFGALLFAILLTLLARPFKRLGLNSGVSLSFAGILLLGVIGAAAYLFGSKLALDIQDVLARMESARQTIRTELSRSPLGSLVLSQFGFGGDIPITQLLTSLFAISTSVIAAIIMSVIAGVYLAAQPKLYLNGFLALFPAERRANVEETVKAVGDALSFWFQGQFISMLLIGLLMTLATWAIGLPSYFALGFIAGVCDFIPYVGPMIGVTPALLVASTQGTDLIFWTALAYYGINTAEGNLIVPLVQRKMVYIPPAVMVLGIAAIGFIFGAVAIFFAAPMTVVIFVLVKKLYVRDFLKEPTSIPGDHQTDG